LLVCLLIALALMSGCRMAGTIPLPYEQGATAALGDRVQIINWNLQKGAHQQMPDDLARMVTRQQPDLLFLQEAKPDLVHIGKMGGVFANSWRYPGYEGSVVGLATLSKVRPSRVSAVPTRYREFWITAPKVSLVTEYPLPNDHTLLAVNVHCLNFERWSTHMLRSQLDDLKQIMQAHDGPIIFSGDFNTWSQRRDKIVSSMVAEIGLQEARIAADVRTGDTGIQWLNWLLGIDPSIPLDRIYYRGLEPLVVLLLPYHSSDHAPIKATFRVLDD
jgi:endonuclease/exonuclease/phosphatase (EEP) superfamily protein YafD